MSLLANLKRLVAGSDPGPTERLYAAIVAEARRPAHYLDGGVPDTLDGRFDMLVLVLSLVLLRLEEETGEDPRHPAARLSADLTDRFITDMDGNLRQDGVGDQVVPRHLGNMVAALGGRLGAYRAARGDAAAMADALGRNLYRGADVPAPARDHLVATALGLAHRLSATSFARLADGQMEPTE